jgi:preprotein translocase subunit SecD
MDLIYKIVRRLRRDDDVNFSRNKNFEAYDDPTVQRAVRLHHHLESIESDLRELVPANRVEVDTVERDGDREIELTFDESEEARRLSYLSPKDWSLLLDDDEVRLLLERLLDETDPSTRTSIRDALDALD